MPCQFNLSRKLRLQLRLNSQTLLEIFLRFRLVADVQLREAAVEIGPRKCGIVLERAIEIAFLVARQTTISVCVGSERIDDGDFRVGERAFVKTRAQGDGSGIVLDRAVKIAVAYFL